MFWRYCRHRKRYHSKQRQYKNHDTLRRRFGYGYGGFLMQSKEIMIISVCRIITLWHGKIWLRKTTIDALGKTFLKAFHCRNCLSFYLNLE
jgi:hypothetical protein